MCQSLLPSWKVPFFLKGRKNQNKLVYIFLLMIDVHLSLNTCIFRVSIHVLVNIITIYTFTAIVTFMNLFHLSNNSFITCSVPLIHAVVRQVALRTFKSEIANLRSQVHQVSLERDKIKTNLNRTLEENKKLVQEGDEHVDLVTKQSERRLK